MKNRRQLGHQQRAWLQSDDAGDASFFRRPIG